MMMKSGRFGVSVSVVLMMSLALGPATALGDPSRGPGGGGQTAVRGGQHAGGGAPRGGGRPVVSHPFGRPGFSHPVHQRPLFPRFGHQFPNHFHRRHFFGGFGFFPVITSTGFGYAEPPFYGASAGYGAPAAIYNVYSPVLEINNAPPGAYNPPVGGVVSAPAAPGVVEYATGRYELHGDGMTAPYIWVWIPNPPPGPPDALGSGEPAPARHGQIYRWTDDQGVMHMTDRLEAVPPEHRTQLKQPS